MTDQVEAKAVVGSVPLSHPGKVLFPGGVTKRALADYYLSVAGVMLPHLKARALAMERYPDGIDGPRIFQRKVPPCFPGWIERVTLERVDGKLTQVVCADRRTLVYLVDQACVTPHAWLSRTDLPDQPDQLVFDLDPSGDDFAAARFAALALRALLDELELPAFAKTTGKRGIHVTVPLDRSLGFAPVRSFARALARELVARHPSRLTVEQRRERRGGRLYLDLMRNAYAQMAVAPYAVRATAQATVATPLAWEELLDPSLYPDRFTLQTIPRRVAKRGDPWAAMQRQACNLERAAGRLDALTGAGADSDCGARRKT